jgi:polyisoprenoid-binding protein YceI
LSLATKENGMASANRSAASPRKLGLKRLAAMLLAVLPTACSRGELSPVEQASNRSAQATQSTPILPVETTAPAGEYRLDKSHASLIFHVSHLGYSNYAGRFDAFDATLLFAPAAPEKMQITATIDARSLAVPTPPDGFLDELKSAAWLDAVGFAEIRYRSTAVRLTGPDTALVDGELTLRGVTAPVALDVKFNGGYAGFPPYDPNARIGFSAHGALQRSTFGLMTGIPTKDQPAGVSDEVSFEIEAEFNGPPAPPQ